MLIKFKKPDPRAGMVARMDSHRGRDLVAAGAADEVKENEAAPAPAPVHAEAPAPATAEAASLPKATGKGKKG